MWVAAGHPHSAYRCPVPNLQNSNPHDFGRHLISHEDWKALCMVRPSTSSLCRWRSGIKTSAKVLCVVRQAHHEEDCELQ